MIPSWVSCGFGHYMFDSYITCLILSLNTVYVYFRSHQIFLFQSWTLIILVALKSILCQSRCSQTTRLHWLLPHSLFCGLCSLLASCLMFAYRAPNWRKQATRKHFLKNLFKEWIKKFIALLMKKKEKTIKNEWESDDSNFLVALYSVHKQLGQFFFHTLPANLFKQRYISSVTSYKYLKNKNIRLKFFENTMYVLTIPLIKF